MLWPVSICLSLMGVGVGHGLDHVTSLQSVNFLQSLQSVKLATSVLVCILNVASINTAKKGMISAM